MTLILETGFDFEVPRELTAHEPAEERGLARDGVRMVVGRKGEMRAEHRAFTDLPEVLTPRDLLVVNNSGTLPAALDGRLADGRAVALHLSSAEPDERGAYLVELRRPDVGGGAARYYAPGDSPARAGLLVGLPGRAQATLTERFTERLWFARLRLPRGLSPVAYLSWYGKAIRYGYVDREWPIEAYQTVFARQPGSVEMPSAARPFSTEVVTDLVGRGIGVAPLVLHTGVSSLEGEERPYPERYDVPRATATAIGATRQNGGRVIAIGTTVVRALATVTDDRGTVHPGRGWTDVMVTADTPVASVDGLVTGWHEPESTHLMMLESFAGRDALGAAYAAALDAGYLWHEFGDSHLIVRTSGRDGAA
jgi:S-adenosylmethionine:tRNA ribosyltransferase-isomerase